MARVTNDQTISPVDLVLHIVGSKWTIAIVDNLVAGPRRPFQLSKALKGINPKTLTERLRELEKWGLIDRHFFHEIPPRVEYSLTERGRELLPVIQVLKQLGEKWQKSLATAVLSERQVGDDATQVEESVIPGSASLPAATGKPVTAGERAGNGHE